MCEILDTLAVSMAKKTIANVESRLILQKDSVIKNAILLKAYYFGQKLGVDVTNPFKAINHPHQELLVKACEDGRFSVAKPLSKSA